MNNSSLSSKYFFRIPVGIFVLGLWTTLCQISHSNAQDWPRFLGESGIATSTKSTLPTKWNAKSNIKWKAELPGPGASSPIVSGDRVYLTCYSGYGDKSDGKIGDLKRHLLCFRRENGKVIWKQTVDNKNVKNEDPYKSYITHHGYATNTPVTDGKTVFAFFGKAGVAAFDADGKKLWHVPVESKINKTRWGSAASPLLFSDF